MGDGGQRKTRAANSRARDEEELWTNVDYVIASTEASLARTHFAGDALPVFCPPLGPVQFAAWLGAELVLKPRAFTSWAKPFVKDWAAASGISDRCRQPVVEALPGCSPGIRARFGRDKWVTSYPDLHTGVDALRAQFAAGTALRWTWLRTLRPFFVRCRQMTELWENGSWIPFSVIVLARRSR